MEWAKEMGFDNINSITLEDRLDSPARIQVSKLKWKERYDWKRYTERWFFDGLLNGILKKEERDWLRLTEDETCYLYLIPPSTPTAPFQSTFFFAFPLDFVPWNKNKLLTYPILKRVVLEVSQTTGNSGLSLLIKIISNKKIEIYAMERYFQKINKGNTFN